MLGWSINLFRVFGIRLSVHFTFLLLVAYAAWSGWTENPAAPWTGLVLDLTLIVLLFTCIVLHELGHSLTARRYGIGVPRILLLPIGGMAEFDSIPREPRRELLISLAGPAVNFAIVLLLLPVVPWPKDLGGDSIEFTMRGLAGLLLRINLIMGAFNLLPIFPMDGGRILRALLATRCSYLQATFWAATTGKVLALLAAVWFTGIVPKLLGHLGHGRWTAFAAQRNLMAVALFLFILIAGELEYRAVRRRELQTAQWETLIRTLYGSAGPEDRGITDYRPGPN